MNYASTPANVEHGSKNSVGGIIILILVLVFTLAWVVLGVGAFIMSLVCFGYNGSMAQNFIGLLLSIFFGPFYWIYYAYGGSYCSK